MKAPRLWTKPFVVRAYLRDRKADTPGTQRVAIWSNALALALTSWTRAGEILFADRNPN